MGLFDDFIEDYYNDLNTQNTKSLNPIIVTMLGATIAIRGTELERLIQKNIDLNMLSQNEQKMIEELKEINEKTYSIFEVLKKWNPKFNRIYVFNNNKAYLEENEEPEISEFIKTKFDVIKEGYGGYPYYSPKGWRRYSLQVKDYDQKYKDWPIAYHGTKSDNLINILTEGFRVYTGKKGQSFGEGVYFSPSIEYCGHWRYGKPKRSITRNYYIQAVFQCKLRPGSFTIHRETMILDDKKKDKSRDPNIDKTKIIDPNFSNKELEWVVSSDTINKLNREGKEAYIIQGIMVRVTKEDPKDLPINKWWSYYEDVPYNFY